jgi:hypothetical protein
MTSGGLHRSSTVVLSVAMMMIGVALLVQAAIGQGGAIVRLLLGVLFIAAGAGRLYVASRRSGGA